MIKSISLNNFESHKKSKLEFCEGVNVISGTSGHGKSSIVKAFDWTFNNKPSGSPFISSFAKGKELTISNVETTDGVIRREKNKSNNQYIINNDHKNPLKALRSDVPDRVQEISKIKPVNIQKQIDQFFLLDKSPGKVAKAFNEVAGLEAMDKALVIANSEVKEIETKTRIKTSDIKATQEKINNLLWVKTADKRLSKIEEIENGIEKATDKHSEIDNVIYDLQSINKQILENEFVDKAEFDLANIYSCMFKIDKVNSNILGLDSILSDIRKNKQTFKTIPDIEEPESVLIFDLIPLTKLNYDTEINSLSKTLLKADKNALRLEGYKDTDIVQKSLKQAIIRAKKEKKTNDLILNINKILSPMKTIKKQILPIKKEIKKLEREESAFKEEIQVCPTCGKLF